MSSAACQVASSDAGTCGPSMTCSYDACTSDAHCAGGVCTPPPFPGAGIGNTCVPGACHVDADCGAGGYCSPSLCWGCIGDNFTASWQCHTCADVCVNDADCPPSACGPQACVFDPGAGHWACQPPC